MGKRILLLGLFMISALTAKAQTIVTDRPDQTEASSTVPAGMLQIESGLLFQSSESEGVEVRSYTYPNTLLRLGVVKNFEFRFVTQLESEVIEANDMVVSNESGMSNLEVGFKYRLLSPTDKRPEIGFLSHAVIPSGTDGLNNNNYGVVNKLAVTHDINDKLSIAYNLGYNYFGTGNGDGFYSLAFGFGLTDRLGVYIEPYGFYNNFEDFVINADAGFTYLINNNTQFDYSFASGINQTMSYHSVGLSVLVPGF